MAHSLEVNDIIKSFGVNRVVDGVSFDVGPGETFGLIGPNGAGKTTTIRMMMDIIKPDSGSVLVLGERLNERTKELIGYLPEERGLYKKLTVIKTLEYIGGLKGMTREHAARRAEAMLKRVGFQAHGNKKIEELSRGMSQIVQFMVTIVHEPRLMILDEPFANLDPVNTELLKEIIFELRQEGKSIILSTHRMNQVEEMCDRVFMINKGKGVLYGDLAKIKSHYRRNSVFLDYEGTLGPIRGGTVKPNDRGSTEILLDEGTTTQDVLEQIVSQGVTVNRYEVSTPPLHDIFLEVVGSRDE